MKLHLQMLNFYLIITQGITFTDGVNTTIIDGTKVESGAIRISGNVISKAQAEI